MPSATGVVHDAGVPARPSISTRQSRQEPNASSMSVAQSFGISMPVSIAARMIEVPSGTETCLPSTESVTVFSDLERGVPKSISCISEWGSDVSWSAMARFLFSSLQARGRAEIFGEVGERAHHRIGREAAERA